MMLLESSNYRELLKTCIRNRPRSGRGEIGRLAKALGVNSTLVSQVLHGTKDFTLEQMHKVAEYFALSEFDSEYLLLLLQKERAGTQELKRYWQAKIEKLRDQSLHLANRLQKERVLSEVERATFYSSWQYSAVRLLTSIEGFQSPEPIAQKLDLPKARVVEILRFLVDAGLVIDKSGRFEMGPQRTFLEKGSPFQARHHQNWRVKSMSRIETISDEELVFTAPISLSAKDFALIREEIVGLIQRISERVKASPAEQLGFINIDWMRL